MSVVNLYGRVTLAIMDGLDTALPDTLVPRVGLALFSLALATPVFILGAGRLAVSAVRGRTA